MSSDLVVSGITVQVRPGKGSFGDEVFNVFMYDETTGKELTLTTGGSLYVEPTGGQLRRMVMQENIERARRQAR